MPERLPGKGLFNSKPFRKKCPANRGLGQYEYAGIDHFGSCYFRVKRVQKEGNAAFLEECWQKIEAIPGLAALGELRKSMLDRNLGEDVIEMLYLIRCKAVHGDLDFVIPVDNEACRAAVFLLHHIIESLICKDSIVNK